MFRRRRMMQANALSQEQLAILIQANRLMAEGKPLEAGALFAQVAQAMQQSNHPRRAANLYARAAHAFSDGNRGQVSLGYARTALGLFIQAQMLPRASVFYANITRKLNAKGMQAAAGELQAEFGTRMAGQPAMPAQASPTAHGLLPTTCPQCGAPVHGDEVSWVDNRTAECEFCGALIRS